jgi:hypothetical protein
MGQGVKINGTLCLAAKMSLSIASKVLTKGDNGSQ